MANLFGKRIFSRLAAIFTLESIFFFLIIFFGASIKNKKKKKKEIDSSNSWWITRKILRVYQ